MGGSCSGWGAGYTGVFGGGGGCKLLRVQHKLVHQNSHHIFLSLPEQVVYNSCLFDKTVNGENVE